MSIIEHSIVVNVPLSTVYNQWTQFELFPQFMENVREVRQLDDKRLHWRAEVGGKTKEWDAVITEQEPDQRIAWRSTSGAPNAGIVTFQEIDANRTRITLRMEYEPEGIIETAGDILGVLSRNVEGDLERFKAFIEAQGRETGAWRGEIHAGTSAARAVDEQPSAHPPSNVQTTRAPGSEAESGMGTGFEQQLGGGLGNVYDRGVVPTTDHGEPTGGLWSDVGDGTIGNVGDKLSEQMDDLRNMRTRRDNMSKADEDADKTS